MNNKIKKFEKFFENENISNIQLDPRDELTEDLYNLICRFHNEKGIDKEDIVGVLDALKDFVKEGEMDIDLGLTSEEGE